jgi:hypothetical protein
MEKKSYINPECKFLEMNGKNGLLQDLNIIVSGSKVDNSGDIGFSKEHDLDEEEDKEIKNLWED